MADEKVTDEKQAKQPSVWQQLRDRWRQQPALSGQFQAMVREFAKDVHNTMDRVFFGQPCGMGEPGTPLCPTQAMVTKDLGTVHGYQSMVTVHASRTNFGPLWPER